MKKIYLALLALTLGVSAQAQRSCDLELTGSIVGNLNVDASSGTQTFYDFKIKNNGPDAIAVTDTIVFGTLYTTIVNGFYGVAIPVGGTVSYKDTALFNAGPADGTYSLCDTILMRSAASAPATDPKSSNNKFCQNVKVVNKTTSISDVFSVSKKIRIQNLAIVPNPATSMISFDFIAVDNSEVVARVMDITGRVVLTNNYGKAYVGQNGYSLDISNLNSGLYFVELNQLNVKSVGKLSKQ